MPADYRPIEQKDFARQHFACFARNGVWGTCGSCPRIADLTRAIYPEFCENFDRYDHRLDLGSLVEQYQRRAG